MPTLRRSAFNQGGSWVADPWDSLEAGNRSAEMQNQQQRMAYDQNNALTAAALARLKSEDYRFAQGRVDNRYMFDQDLQARNHSEDRRYQYMDKSDARADARDQTAWDRQTDPTKNPWLGPQLRTNELQGNLAAAQLQDLMDARERTKNRPPPTFSNPTEQTRYNADIDAGVTPSAAAAQLEEERRKKAEGDIGIEEDALGSDLGRFSEKDNSVIGWDPSDASGGSLAGRLAKLEEHLRIGLQMERGAAHERANNLLRKNTKTSWNSGRVDELRRVRQLPE